MFNRRDMARVASASTGAQANWLYQTDDDLSTLLSGNYFLKAFTSLRIGDLIQVRNLDGFSFLEVTASFHDLVDVLLAPILNISPASPEEVLVGFSFDNQNPVGVDVPLIIQMGDTIGDSNDPVSMVNNIIQINQSGVYSFRFLFPISRPTAAGIAYIFIRSVVDGAQFGNPITAILDDNNMSIPLEFTFTSFLPAGTSIFMEMYRDSAGNDSGGLVSTSSSINWGQSASAAVRVTKFG